MPRSRTDLHHKIREMINHFTPLPPQADCPIQHFERTITVGRFVKRFLSETGAHTNERVGIRLAQLLTDIHSADPTMFDALAEATKLSRLFQLSSTINGQTGAP